MCQLTERPTRTDYNCKRLLVAGIPLRPSNAPLGHVPSPKPVLGAAECSPARSSPQVPSITDSTCVFRRPDKGHAGTESQGRTPSRVSWENTNSFFFFSPRLKLDLFLFGLRYTGSPKGLHCRIPRRTDLTSFSIFRVVFGKVFRFHLGTRCIL